MFTVFTMTEARERILACACELYLDDGFEGFSMRKLATQVGVTAPALYRHFAGKEELLLEVVKEGYRSMVQYLYRALGGESAAERFRMAGDAYVDFALENPRYYEILYSYTQFLGLDELPEEIWALIRGVHQFWLDRVRECMESGTLRQGDPEEVARSFWAMSHGLISVYQRQMLQVDEEGFRGIYAESMCHLMEGVGVSPSGEGVAGEQAIEGGEGERVAG
jgi:AcrR family transcriptional regulator